ncbi:hypothetical protein BC830DRAFT_1085392 [Chytriomyces sp. MP71]|nr:hypothetical protein BC830DRAFT_1085392 [Chytriomyces sp. MP71]
MATKKKTPTGKNKGEPESSKREFSSFQTHHDTVKSVSSFSQNVAYSLTTEGAYKELEGGSGIIRQGEGKQIAPTYIYNGNWEQDKMHGKGVVDRNTPGRLEFLETGAVYDGQWRENKFMGQGSYKWADGSVLTAEWEGNRVNGPGKFQDRMGQSWIGSFVKGSTSSLSAEIL